VYKEQILSFVSGIVVTYLFLVLFPEFALSASLFSPFLFFSVLAGFIVFHVREKFIYTKIKNQEKLEHYLRSHHQNILFIEHIILGIVLVSFFESGLFAGALFSIPVILFVMGSGISMNHLHQIHVHQEKPIKKVILALPILIGTGISLIYAVPLLLQEILIGFIIGSFTMIIIREVVPGKRKGDPKYFLLGSFLYSLLIIINWTLL